MTEKDVAKLCDELAEKNGWHVQRCEQRRATKIHRGLPDRRYVHRTKLLRIWCELKAPGAKLTEDQHRWLIDELHCDSLAVVVDDVQQLVKLFNILNGPRIGRMEEAREYCRELVRLTVQRGYRRDAA